MTRVWERFMTDEDRRVAANGNLRKPRGPGRKVGLLVIDMQITACGEDRPISEQLDRFPGSCGPQAWAAIRVQQRILGTARASGMPVIYSKHVFHAYTGRAAAASGVFAATDPRSQIQPDVAMQPGDILIEKQTPSCFAFTNLIPILAELGIDGLLVMGNSTSGCVRATCVDGEAAGFHMTVIEDCVFDRIEMSHAASLFDLSFKICDVVDEARAIEIINQPFTGSGV